MIIEKNSQAEKKLCKFIDGLKFEGLDYVGDDSDPDYVAKKRIMKSFESHFCKLLGDLKYEIDCSYFYQTYLYKFNDNKFLSKVVSNDFYFETTEYHLISPNEAARILNDEDFYHACPQ